jgi:hypothetical protein
MRKGIIDVRRAVGLLAALMVAAPPLGAQIPAQMAHGAALVYARNTAAAAYEYCILAGQNGRALDQGIPISIPIAFTSGSTATAAVTALTEPFLHVAVGDELRVNIPSAGTATKTQEFRYVTARADSDNVTASANWPATVTSTNFTFKKLTCGTAATDGVIGVNGATVVRFSVEVTAISATSIDIQIEGRDRSAATTWTVLDGKSYTATGSDAFTLSSLMYDEVRIGMKVTGDTGTQAVTIHDKVG